MPSNPNNPLISALVYETIKTDRHGRPIRAKGKGKDPGAQWWYIPTGESPMATRKPSPMRDVPDLAAEWESASQYEGDRFEEALSPREFCGVDVLFRDAQAGPVTDLGPTTLIDIAYKAENEIVEALIRCSATSALSRQVTSELDQHNGRAFRGVIEERPSRQHKGQTYFTLQGKGE